MAQMIHSIGGEKIQALRRMLAARGLDERDFDIEEDSHSGISQLLGLSGGIVSMRRRSTGEIRVFDDRALAFAQEVGEALEREFGVREATIVKDRLSE